MKFRKHCAKYSNYTAYSTASAVIAVLGAKGKHMLTRSTFLPTYPLSRSTAASPFSTQSLNHLGILKLNHNLFELKQLQKNKITGGHNFISFKKGSQISGPG